MNRLQRGLLVLGVLLVPAALLARAVLVQQGGTWSVDFDDPNKAGNVTVTVKVSYEDALGKKQTKDIATTVRVDPAWDATAKKTNVQTALDTAINNDANKVNGQALAETGGSGDVMTATPKPDSAGNFTNAKVEKVWVSDVKTGEDDKVTKPAQSVGLAEVTMAGDIVGGSADAPSGFSVLTDLGLVTVELSAGMRKLEVLDVLRAGLSAQGARTWVDYDRDALFVYVDGEVITGVGAGTTDRGLTSRCSVMGQ